MLLKNNIRVTIRIFSYCLLIFIVSFFSACEQNKPVRIPTPGESRPVLDDLPKIVQAYYNKQSNIWVESHGTVTRLLSDDIKGSRHQRFILKLRNGQTLLISHNIDLAPRVDELAVGDEVRFKGEYEYNEKGGVVHWTHRDPQMRHSGGWIEHNGYIYK